MGKTEIEIGEEQGHNCQKTINVMALKKRIVELLATFIYVGPVY